jgi:hypothetical protein
VFSKRNRCRQLTLECPAVLEVSLTAETDSMISMNLGSSCLSSVTRNHDPV